MYNLIFCKCFGFRSVIRKVMFLQQKRFFYKTHIRKSFFEPDRRGGPRYAVFPDKHWKEHVRDGRKIFANECKLWFEEIKEKFQQDRKWYKHGDTDIFFKFTSEDCLKRWRVSSDKKNNEGFSECSLIINDKGKGIFSGTVDTSPPKDGKNRFTGYCAIKSVDKMKSFLRADSYDWSPFTHLELRVKGDGRNYAVTLGLSMYFDVTWFDLFTYNMFTHGGPYWQTVRIPFSKFFLTSKGRIQDRQHPLLLCKVNSVGIMCAAVPGPFRLEIDYIGCHVDESHTEKFAYELYKLPKEMVSN